MLETERAENIIKYCYEEGGKENGRELCSSEHAKYRHEWSEGEMVEQMLVDEFVVEEREVEPGEVL